MFICSDLGLSTGNGLGFNIKSFHAVFHHMECPMSILSHVWSIQAPPKVMAYGWMAIQDSIMTVDHLCNRQKDCNSMALLYA